MQNNKNLNWSSQAMFIFATAGAAIGLGNIWKFPYMLGQNGGSAFLVVYLICVITIGVPLMMAELLLGRYSKQNPIDGIATIANSFGHNEKIKYIGYLCLFGLVITLSFYSVVSGWAIAYACKFFMLAIASKQQALSNTYFTDLLHNPLELIFWHTLFLFATMYIVSKGLSAGLEKSTKLLMPMLFLLLAVLVFYSLQQGDVKEAFSFLFAFKYTEVTTSVTLSAMGHAFFTLALGAGAIMTYGRYIDNNTSIAKTVLIIAGLDTLISILAGLAIFPMVFAFGLNPAEGPTLMFSTMPKIFATIAWGNLLGGTFFLFLFIAALTSSINIAQPIVTTLQEKTSLNLKRSALIAGIIIWLVGNICLLSFNILQDVTLKSLTIFDIATQIPDKFVLPIGGLSFALITGWIMRKEVVRKLLPMPDNYIFKIWWVSIRYFAPAATILIILSAWLR